MSAVLPPTAALPGTVVHGRSQGVWQAAWRRLRADRVGLTSLAVVLLFLLLIVLTATHVVAGGWQKEVGVPSAPPTFLGPAASAPANAIIAAPSGPPIDISAVDPLAPRYKEWAERAAQYKTVETPRALTLPFGADRLGRDVLSKALKGTQTSVFVGLLGAVVATLIGTVLGAFGGYFGGKTGDFLEWLYSVFTAVPDVLLILSFAVIFAAASAASPSSSPSSDGPACTGRCGPSSSSTRRATTCARPRPSAPRCCRACSATSCPTSAT